MSEYEKQAEDFLKKCNVTLRLRSQGLKVPRWEEHGEEHATYTVILQKPDSKRVSFTFYDSLDATQKGEKPTAYDVLACISGDTTLFDTFQDFCGEFGYNEDSRKAFATWRAYDRLAQKLNAFFTEKELEALREIR